MREFMPFYTANADVSSEKPCILIENYEYMDFLQKKARFFGKNTAFALCQKSWMDFWYNRQKRRNIGKNRDYLLK